MRFGAIFIICDLFVVIASVIQLITLQVFKEDVLCSRELAA